MTLLEIHAPGLKESNVIKAGIFLIPLGDDKYLAGATYSHKDKRPEPSQEGREILLNGLAKVRQSDFKVTGQRAGMRPTVPDRRPLGGTSRALAIRRIDRDVGVRHPKKVMVHAARHVPEVPADQRLHLRRSPNVLTPVSRRKESRQHGLTIVVCR